MLQLSAGEDTDLTWVKLVTLSWSCLGQTKLRDRPLNLFPTPQIPKKLEYASGNNNGFKAFKLVNKQAEREKKKRNFNTSVLAHLAVSCIKIKKTHYRITLHSTTP